MRIIWQGTDSLFLVKFPKQLKKKKIFYVMALRIFARLTDFFSCEHFACGILVENNLRKFGMKKPIKQYKSPPKFIDIVRQDHSGFNILYYLPKNANAFRKWLYGYDIFLEIEKYFKSCKKWNIFIVDGSYDMNKIYPIIDCLIRPNRHDGISRMISECKEIGIPYIWSQENPDLEYFIEKIRDIYLYKTK